MRNKEVVHIAPYCHVSRVTSHVTNLGSLLFLIRTLPRSTASPPPPATSPPGPQSTWPPAWPACLQVFFYFGQPVSHYNLFWVSIVQFFLFHAVPRLPRPTIYFWSFIFPAESQVGIMNTIEVESACGEQCRASPIQEMSGHPAMETRYSNNSVWTE